jgi:hypothetical protein
LKGASAAALSFVGRRQRPGPAAAELIAAARKEGASSLHLDDAACREDRQIVLRRNIPALCAPSALAPNAFQRIGCEFRAASTRSM